MLGVLFCLITAKLTTDLKADDTWVYAVQLTAAGSTTPPKIELRWVSDPYGALDYTLFRKEEAEAQWGASIAVLPGNATNYTDAQVVIGRRYEYQVIKRGSLGYKGFGYLATGIEAPLEDQQGGILLVTETNATRELGTEIGRLVSDLEGDGWQVFRIGVSSNDPPENVKSRMYSLWLQAPEQITAAFLLGHVPVMHSGDLDWDTHGKRPMPSDAYYADINHYWPTNVESSPSYLPSPAELMVGRVDFHDMPGLRSATPWPSESELLKNYLEKNHRWRHAQVTVPRRALMGNARGDEYGGAAAASGYRVLDAFVGAGNTVEANVSYSPPFGQRWISRLGSESFLWAYGCGGGQADGCGGLGTNVVGGVPGYLYSSDVLAVDAKAVFVMMFGSWFGQWDLTDNLLRSFLATKSLGLAGFMAGRPHWFLHHVGMGKPLGYSARLTMNNQDLYQSQSNGFPRAVYIALMGDPTLRMEPMPPAVGLSAEANPEGVLLRWQAPPGANARGYHVYRASDAPNRAFVRLTPESATTDTSFLDRSVATAGLVHYMVRAVYLQVNPSGSYFNASQGVFASTSVENQTPPIRLELTRAGNQVELRWNAKPGVSYRVQALTPDLPLWQDLSGPLTTTEQTLSWTEQVSAQPTARLYRIRSP